MKKKLSLVLAVAFVFAAIFAGRLLIVSNTALVQRLEHLMAEDTRAHKSGDKINNGYEENLIRSRLVQRGYLARVIFEMPNTRTETEQAAALWNALLKFRDKACSPVAIFSFWPADGSTNVLYVIVRDLPERIPQWKTTLLKWDKGAKEAEHLKGPSGAPEAFPSP